MARTKTVKVKPGAAPSKEHKAPTAAREKPSPDLAAKVAPAEPAPAPAALDSAGLAAALADGRLPVAQRQTMAAILGRRHGNQYLQRALVQRFGDPPGPAALPAAPGPAPAPGPDAPAKTAAQAVEIDIGPSAAVVFSSKTATVGDLNVRFTGRMAISGQSSLVGEALPEKKKEQAAFLKKRTREQLKAAFDAAAPTGSMTKVELAIGGETLTLELAGGAEKQPAFQVSSHFSAEKRSLAVGGVEVTGANIVLDATAWISPAKPPPPTPDDKKPAPPGDASVTRFAFAGQQALFGGGDARTGSVSLKSDMDAFDAKLPDIVKNHRFLQLPEQRAAFFQEMRAYFGSDAKTIDHFAKIRKANVKGATTFLHEEAATRLEAVQAELGEANMPSSGGVGWPRKECTLGGSATLANLHNLGFAVDYNAYQTPHIKDQRILDLMQITIGRSPSLNYNTPAGIDTRAIGETYTKGTEEEKAKLDADKKVQDWLDGVEKEAAAMGKASDAFRESLKGKDASGAETDNAPKLQELRKKWFEAKSKVAAARQKEKKAKKADKAAATAEREAAEKEQNALQDELKVVLKPWLDKISAQKTGMETKIKAAGLDPAALPSGKKLDEAESAAAGLDKRIQAFLPKLGAELKKGQRKQIDGFIAEAKKMTGDTAAAPADDAAAITELRRLAGLVDKRQAALVQKKWLDRMANLEKGLTEQPALVFGASSKLNVKDPALAQMVDIGFFNLAGQAKAGKEAFSPAFVKSMIKHGFNHGGTWGTPDYMHFELRWKGPAG